MTDEKIKQEVLEEWKDDLKNRGLINIDDGELIYNMSDIEEAIDLTIKKCREEFEKERLEWVELCKQRMIDEHQKIYEKLLVIYQKCDDTWLQQIQSDIGDLCKELNTGEKITSAIKTPDGISFVASFPLPKSHWIYEEHGEPPSPLKTDSIETRMWLESVFKEAVKYAIQASTMSGKEMDFDPDAMVQNFMVALFGYYPLNFPRDTIHIKKQLPNGKVLEYIISNTICGVVSIRRKRTWKKNKKNLRKNPKQ